MPRRAFTLVELIVVVIILAVVAGIVLPRLGGNALRQASIEAEAVRLMLSTAADQHGTLGAPTGRASGAQPDDATVGGWGAGGATTSAVEYSAALKQLRLVERSAAARSAGSARAEARWEPLPLVEPVDLQRCTIEQVSIDGESFAATADHDWRVLFQPGLPRPTISLLLTAEGGSASWQIDLPAAGSTVLLRELPAATRALRPPVEGPTSPIDLDAAGVGESAW